MDKALDVLSPSPGEARSVVDRAPADFPFHRELTLAPLVRAWEAAAAQPGVPGELARQMVAEARRVPELTGAVTDPTLLVRHAGLVAALLTAAFPALASEGDLGAAVDPFGLDAFHATPAMRHWLLDDARRLRGRLNIDPDTFAAARVVRACELILEKWYGLPLRLDYPLVSTVPDPASGLDRHFRLRFDARFIDVDAVGEVAALTAAERQRLASARGDFAVFQALLPVDRFVFRGFGVLRATDITDPEVLSGLKRDLIERESFVSPVRFESLQRKLRTLLRQPDLRLGVAAIQGDQVLMLTNGARLEHACIFADSVHRRVQDFAGSVYARAAAQARPLVVDDLMAYPERTPIEAALAQSGLRSLMVAPLLYQDRPIGMLELGSPRQGAFDPMDVLKLHEVLPLFSMAVWRGLEELNARIEAVIKEQCTAIHPSVEWRFRQAVLRGLDQNRAGEAFEMEPIVFPGVYPLYGATDIRGSSNLRNQAIQMDLGTHLRLAREVVTAAQEVRPLPILAELVHRVEGQLWRIEASLASGDEVAVIAFLREHVEPRLEHLASFGPTVRDRVAAYRAALDPALGTVHRHRKVYEDAVTLVNDAIASCLDAEEELAQAMYPHYFEKQRTDGVEYSIYAGAALVEGGGYDELYVRNLRLWQLLVTCGIARRVEALRPRITLPLEATHLILAHHTPLALRFRVDEKRFDVDGAYNVRYEVVKKRVDKAVVRGTGERLTQPGRIAIVYSQSPEAAEYREYLDYLRTTGHLTGPVEELELDELQGVHGLRALRVAVDLSAVGAEPPDAARQAAAAVRTLTR